MKVDKSYELFPGIRVTDADTMEANHGKRLDLSKFPQFSRDHFHENGYTDQEVRDKIGKNKSWAVCSSWTDWSAKKMYFDVAVNAQVVDVRSVDFDDICGILGWKSAKWNADRSMVKPVLN